MLHHTNICDSKDRACLQMRGHPKKNYKKNTPKIMRRKTQQLISLLPLIFPELKDTEKNLIQQSEHIISSTLSSAQGSSWSGGSSSWHERPSDTRLKSVSVRRLWEAQSAVSKQKQTITGAILPDFCIILLFPSAEAALEGQTNSFVRFAVTAN